MAEHYETPVFDHLDLSKSDVAAMTDVGELTSIYEQIVGADTHLTEFLGAFRAAEIDDETWFRRTAGKLAYLRISGKWVERRLLTLGAEVPYPPSDPRARALRLLNEKVEKLTNKVALLERAA